MDLIAAALIGSAVAAGALLITLGFRRHEPEVSPRVSPGLWTKWEERWRRIPVLRRRIIVTVFVVSILVGVATGWLIAPVAIPLAALGIPALLTAPPQREIEVLAALDRWVRLLAPVIGVGKSIRDAIAATRGQAPEILADSVNRLVARMDQGWTTSDALLAMADELDLADADAVLAALAMASRRGGTGTRATLNALTENIQNRLQLLREIAAERAKPRAVIRQVTYITIGILLFAIFFGGQFFAPYATPLGQICALGLLVAYLGCLVILRRRTTVPPTARFLRAAA